MPYPVRAGVPQSARLNMTRCHSLDSFRRTPTSSPPEGLVRTHLSIGSERRASSYLSGLGEPEGEEVNLNMMDLIRHLRSREEGQALVEYALILTLVTLFCLVSLQLVSTNLDSLLDSIASAVAGAI